MGSHCAHLMDEPKVKKLQACLQMHSWTVSKHVRKLAILKPIKPSEPPLTDAARIWTNCPEMSSNEFVRLDIPGDRAASAFAASRILFPILDFDLLEIEDNLHLTKVISTTADVDIRNAGIGQGDF